MSIRFYFCNKPVVKSLLRPVSYQRLYLPFLFTLKGQEINHPAEQSDTCLKNTHGILLPVEYQRINRVIYHQLHQII